MVFGKRNGINPTDYLDGGLFDNLPVGALETHLMEGEIDCLLVVDVSGNAKAFRDGILGFRIRRETPCLYVGLSRVGDPLRRLLDFSMAESLFTLGYKTGNKAVRKWFSGGFSPVSSFLDSPSILPETHVIRAMSVY